MYGSATHVDIRCVEAKIKSVSEKVIGAIRFKTFLEKEGGPLAVEGLVIILCSWC